MKKSGRKSGCGSSRLRGANQAGLSRKHIIEGVERSLQRLGVDYVDESEVLNTVFEALGKGDAAADLARAFMRPGQGLGVKRMEPVWTNRGKLMPLHLVRHTDRSA